MSSVQVEAYALLRSSQEILDLGVENIEIWTDCSTLFKGLQVIEQAPPLIRKILGDVMVTLDNFSSYKVMKVSREKVSRAN